MGFEPRSSDLFIEAKTLEVGGDLRDRLVEGWFPQQNVAGFHAVGLENQPMPKTRASSQAVL